MKYNHVHDVVISADAKGHLEYWLPSTLKFPEDVYVVSPLHLSLISFNFMFVFAYTLS
jgi:hypothetical protein